MQAVIANAIDSMTITSTNTAPSHLLSGIFISENQLTPRTSLPIKQFVLQVNVSQSPFTPKGAFAPVPFFKRLARAPACRGLLRTADTSQLLSTRNSDPDFRNTLTPFA